MSKAKLSADSGGGTARNVLFDGLVEVKCFNSPPVWCSPAKARDLAYRLLEAADAADPPSGDEICSGCGRGL